MHPFSHSRQAAFTLVELSIVLVILGLLVGGVLTGQSLIRAAELRSVSSEFQQHVASINSFRDKYFAIPGDMPNAVRFWGAQAGATTDGVDTTCSTLTSASPASGTATCNGDGNGFVGTSSTGAAYEWHRAWQQLANAGLVTGTYTGVSGGAVNLYTVVPGTNGPRAKIANAGWTLRGLGVMPVSAVFFGADYGNMLQFGATVANDWPNGGALKAEEAWNIDTKLDDGLPQSGRIVTYKNGTRPNCINTTNDAYLLTDTTLGCNLMFLRI